MPLLHNQRWINWGLCVVLYFVIKRIIKVNSEELILKCENHVLSGNYKPTVNSLTLNSLTKRLNSLTIHSLIINLLIFSALCQSLWGLFQLYGFLPSFNGYFKITGTFFNPAPYAMYLAIIFPMALAKVLYHKKIIVKREKVNSEELKVNSENHALFANHKPTINSLTINFSLLTYYFSFTTVLAILLVLPATMIRAAWLAAAVGALVVAWPWLKTHTRLGAWLLVLGSNIKYKIIALTAAIVLIGAIGSGLFYLKKDSANGKLFIWEVTLGKIAQKPLFGYGVGRFEAEYNNWQAEYFKKHPREMDGPKGWVAGNTKYAFNEFLEMASETGIIGLLLFMAIIGILLLNCHTWSLSHLLPFHSHSLLKTAINDVKQMTINENEVNDGYRSNDIINDRPNFQNSIILSFVVLLFISFPLYSLPTFIILAFLLVIFQTGKQPAISAVAFKVPPYYKYALAALILPMVPFLSKYNYLQYTGYYHWDEANKLYNIGAYPNASKSFERVKDNMKYNGSFLQYYGKALTMEQNYSRASLQLKQAQLNTSDEVLFITLGDCYKALKKYNQAEAAYLYAASMTPHKLYPHYLLAKMYEQSGNQLKAKEKAKYVLSMKTKIENIAANEIKMEMGKIINTSL